MLRFITEEFPILHNNAFVFLLEPSNSIILGDSVLIADSSRLDLSSSDSVSRAN